MFNSDFFPTPINIIQMMLEDYNVSGKVILEPSAGSGNFVSYLLNNNAKSVIACELHDDLRKIVESKCKVIAPDFLTVTSDQISHIDAIIMNPPFSVGDKHINHAFEIAPPGCKIIALCNYATYDNDYSRERKKFVSTINNYGTIEQLGDVFSDAERTTGVNVGLVKLQKPGASYEQEFEGFFLDDDPEEKQYTGIMPYNVIRDLVNRYITAVKIFDEQLETAQRLHYITNNFFVGKIGMRVTKGDAPVTRCEFKKDLQKAAWNWVFEKMNMQKYATKGLKEDINKFVEQQQQIPFTMRNVYKMIEIVIATHDQRMDKAILEVFDKVTMHHADNQYHIEGWKTNSHFMLTEKFILPYLVNVGWSGQMEVTHYSDRYETIDDLHKALCNITGKNYDDIGSMWSFNHIQTEDSKYIIHEFGKWYDFGMFEVKGFKKGSMHFKFKDKDVWGKFNQHVARLKGYPLFEPKAQTKYQNKQTGRDQQNKSNPAHAYKPHVAA